MVSARKTRWLVCCYLSPEVIFVIVKCYPTITESVPSKVRLLRCVEGFLGPEEQAAPFALQIYERAYHEFARGASHSLVSLT